MNRLFRPGSPLILSILVLHIAPTKANAEDGCDAVLGIGLQNTYSSVRTHQLHQAIREWACETSASELGQASSGALGIIADGVPLKARLDHATIQREQHSVCSDKVNNLDQSSLEQIAQHILSPFARDAIDAWKSCKQAEHLGLNISVGNYDETGSSFTLSVRWLAPIARLSPPIVKSLSKENMDCSGWPLQKDRPVPRAVSVICKRNPKQPTRLVLSTEDSDYTPIYIAPSTISKARAATRCDAVYKGKRGVDAVSGIVFVANCRNMARKGAIQLHLAGSGVIQRPNKDDSMFQGSLDFGFELSGKDLGSVSQPSTNKDVRIDVWAPTQQNYSSDGSFDVTVKLVNVNGGQSVQFRDDLYLVVEVLEPGDSIQ